MCLIFIRSGMENLHNHTLNKIWHFLVTKKANVFLLICAIALFSFGIYCTVVNKNPWVIVTIFIIGFICLMLSVDSKFLSFEIWNTKVKLTRAKNELDHSVESMKSLCVSICELIPILRIKSSGFSHNYSLDKIETLIYSITDQLKKIGVEPVKTNEVMAAYSELVFIELLNTLHQKGFNSLHEILYARNMRILAQLFLENDTNITTNPIHLNKITDIQNWSQLFYGSLEMKSDIRVIINDFVQESSLNEKGKREFKEAIEFELNVLEEYRQKLVSFS